MSSTSNYYRLASTVYDGTIGGIHIRWSSGAVTRLDELAQSSGAPAETIKALTEHVVYASAYRLQNKQAVIRSVPHDYSIDSKTGVQHPDGLHVSAELSGGTTGRNNTHIYLGGLGSGVTAYDKMYTTGESVMKKVKGRKELDTSLSIGNYSITGLQNYSTTASMTTATAYAGSSSSGAAGGSTFGEWVWDQAYSKYRHLNNTTNQWEWAPDEET